jgi:hypothetical protein
VGATPCAALIAWLPTCVSAFAPKAYISWRKYSGQSTALKQSNQYYNRYAIAWSNSQYLPAILFSLTLVSAWPGFIDNLAGRHTTTESLEARDGAGGACEDGEFHCDGKTLHKCDHKGESWYDLHQVYLSCALASLMLSMGDGLRVRYELCCRRVRREPCVHLVYASCMFAAPLNSRGGKTSLIVPGGQERVW